MWIKYANGLCRVECFLIHKIITSKQKVYAFLVAQYTEGFCLLQNIIETMAFCPTTMSLARGLLLASKYY
jgi:hypothetical protein